MIILDLSNNKIYNFITSPMSMLDSVKNAITRLPKKVDNMIFWGNVEKLIGDLFQAWNSVFNAFKHPIEAVLNSWKSTPPAKSA